MCTTVKVSPWCSNTKLFFCDWHAHIPVKKNAPNARLTKFFFMIRCFMGLKIQIILLKIPIENFLQPAQLIDSLCREFIGIEK